MRRKHFLTTILLLCVVFYSRAQQLTAGTYNFRYDNKRDSGNLWINRAPVIAALIRFHDFDILGTQEAFKNQLEDIKTALPGYAYYGIGRDDGKEKGEHSAIFYKTTKFKVIKTGDFWLSETPEKPAPGWDARINRICSWVQLQENLTKKKFYFFSVHYDHQGGIARLESSKLILKKIKEIAGNAPAIFAGDLNGDHDSECYKILSSSRLLKDTYTEAKFIYANNGSFNAFGKQVDRNDIIDHLFTTKGFTIDKWGILTDTYHGKYPSDHFPVLVKLKMGK